MDRGAWWAAVHGIVKIQTRLSDFTFTFHFHALEKEMATHSSILAWRIPGMAEPGGLLSTGSHRVRHDWSDLAAAAAAAAVIVGGFWSELNWTELIMDHWHKASVLGKVKIITANAVLLKVWYTENSSRVGIFIIHPQHFLCLIHRRHLSKL